MPLINRLSAGLLGVFGWRVTITPPPEQHGVVIVYPHTSNWDFVLGVLARSVIGLRMHWVGKHTLFRWPFNGVMRWLGGIPVDRSHTNGLVEQLKAEVQRYPQMYLTMTPEGTRKHTPYWKSGFYHLALGLNVPVGLARFDYATKQISLTHWYHLTGDREKDLAYIREVYAGCRGKYQSLAGEIRFRD